MTNWCNLRLRKPLISTSCDACFPAIITTNPAKRRLTNSISIFKCFVYKDLRECTTHLEPHRNENIQSFHIIQNLSHKNRIFLLVSAKNWHKARIELIHNEL